MTAYDAVRYPNHPHVQTHPDRLATLATLFGMSPAPVERCRVLELGAGDGDNLIPMAFGLPHSEFTGIDFAAGPVADGARVIERLGLGNIRLLAMDLMEVGEDFGEFDYIIAHGLYSWAPAEVREHMLALCRRHLAPAGVAFISYNAYPGCHIRQMLREIMLYHTAGMEDPEESCGKRARCSRWFARRTPSRAWTGRWRTCSAAPPARFFTTIFPHLPALLLPRIRGAGCAPRSAVPGRGGVSLHAAGEHRRRRRGARWRRSNRT